LSIRQLQAQLEREIDKRRCVIGAHTSLVVVAVSTPWWAWLLPLVFGAPWLVGIAWFWHHRPRDGDVPPSMADQIKKRLWT
jgi:hypothetical protein